MMNNPRENQCEADDHLPAPEHAHQSASGHSFVMPGGLSKIAHALVGAQGVPSDDNPEPENELSQAMAMAAEDDPEISVLARTDSMFSYRVSTAPRFNGPLATVRSRIHDLLHSQSCHAVVSCIIVLNAAMIGLEQTYRNTGTSPDHMQELELCCLAAYTMELGLHLFTDPARILSDRWLMFDAAIVGLGIADLALTAFASRSTMLENVTVFRLLRLLRLMRTIKLLKRIRVLWMLVSGLMESVSLMLNTVMLLMIVMYVFSCISMEVITASELAVGPNADPEFQAVVDRYFCNLPVTMLTLLQFLCMDSIGDIYKPLVERQPALVIFFGSILLVIPIVMLNLVTAVIVSGAINGGKRDKKALTEHEDSQKKKLIKNLSRIFHRLDTDDSGMVSAREFMHLSDADLDNLGKMTGLTNPMELFRMVDFDDSGELDIDEFCESLWHIVVDKVPIDTRRMEKRVEGLYDHMRKTKQVDVALLESVGELVACQKAVLDSRHVTNRLEEKISAVEKVLQEITGREAQHQDVVSSRHSLNEAQKRICGIRLDKQDGQGFLEGAGSLDWANNILCELQDLRQQLNGDVGLSTHRSRAALRPMTCPANMESKLPTPTIGNDDIDIALCVEHDEHDFVPEEDSPQARQSSMLHWHGIAS
eukprot:TRINITY_DN2512_c0_g2_i1.p1 TRINITY_DN2512_c0_g2~~TRINITY_DN2512_c0_g2_i1.p1  ORF type:complete len:650 (-),score=86.27 TRINITY_DN2512_c0_g2_i1:278-2227(-)